MEKAYALIINGRIDFEDEDGEILHTMTGFENMDKAYILIENMKNMYEIMEIFS